MCLSLLLEAAARLRKALEETRKGVGHPVTIAPSALGRRLEGRSTDCCGENPLRTIGSRASVSSPKTYGEMAPLAQAVLS